MTYGRRIENGETLRFGKVSDEEATESVRKVIGLGVNFLCCRCLQ